MTIETFEGGNNNMIRQVRKTLRGSAGFTLVELVVVIAVLGILAGVGTVGYSGYIQRANEAVDDTLYHDIIYAGAIGSYADPGVTGSVTVDKAGARTENDTIAQWMSNAFGSGWQGTVKYKTDTYANGSTTGTIYLPAHPVELDDEQQALADKYKDSNFYGHEEEIVETVGDITGMFSQWLTEGGDLSGYFGGEENYQAFLEQFGLTTESSSVEKANAMVKYLASQAANMKQADVDALFENVIMTGAVPVDKDLLPNLAAFYGVMTGYANSEYVSEGFKNLYNNTTVTGIDDVETLMDAFIADSESNYENFLAYYGLDSEGNPTGSSQAKSDLEGYLSALSLLDNFDVQIDMTDPDAFNSVSIKALLQGILNASK